ARGSLDSLQVGAELCCRDLEQGEVVLGEPSLAARPDRQGPDPVVSNFQPADLDAAETKRAGERMWPAFDHRLDPSGFERLQGEHAELVRAEAGRGGEMQLAILVEQPDRRDVDRKGGNE